MKDRLFQYEYWGNDIFKSQTNMALEEFLIKRVAEEKREKHLAAIRFYSFFQDSIVLGYAQDTDIIKKLDVGVELTRRITGGSHVQTGQNTLAYSFVVPRDGTFLHFEEMRAHFAFLVARALESLGIGPIYVDNKASTINLNGRIIASHAMFWGVKSALLHGIVILTPYDVDKIAERVVLSERDIGGEIYSEYSALKKLPTVSMELLKKRTRLFLTPPFLRELVARAILKEVTGEKFKSRIIDRNVIKQSMGLLKQRYGSQIWVKEHLPTFTKEEVEEIPGEELVGPLKQNLGYCLFIQVENSDFKRMAEPANR